jgi:hypothetical protein
MQRFFNPDLSLDTMLQRIGNDRLLPSFMVQIVRLGCLASLRPIEIVVESVRLINDKEALAKYYDPGQMTRDHYKFPVFTRTTKKAYVSFVAMRC